MTWNDLQQHIILYFAFFSLKFIALLSNYVTGVEDIPIMSAKYSLPFAVFHYWPNLTHPAVQSLCNSWATC